MDTSRKLWFNPVPESEDGESDSDSSSSTMAGTHAIGGQGGESSSPERAFDSEEEEGAKETKKSRKRGEGEGEGAGRANRAAAMNHPSLKQQQKRRRRNSSVLAQRAKAGGEDPVQKMVPSKFSAEAEMALSEAVLRHVQSGQGLPGRSSDEFWNSISGSHTKDQLCEKLRRMREKYLPMAAKRTHPKSGHEEALLHIWNQIWARNPTTIKNKKHTPVKVHPKGGGNRRRVEPPTQQQDPLPSLSSNTTFMMELQSFLNSEKDMLISTIQTACEKLPQATMLAGTSFTSAIFGSSIQDVAASSALKDKWCKQHLQELKVFSQRLQLIKEHCSLQQQQLESQLQTGKF